MAEWERDKRHKNHASPMLVGCFAQLVLHADNLPRLARCALVQKRTGGISEFVPLPFVHMEAPLYLKGGCFAKREVWAGIGMFQTWAIECTQ